MNELSKNKIGLNNKSILATDRNCEGNGEAMRESPGCGVRARRGTGCRRMCAAFPAGRAAGTSADEAACGPSLAVP